MVTQPRKRKHQHDPSDELLEARAQLALLKGAQRSLPHRTVVVLADGDTEAYDALQTESSTLPARIRVAEETVLEAEFSVHRAKGIQGKRAKRGRATVEV